ncbi:MAG: hypothetical protein L0Z62_30940 [Gemmataceae bacterium]|nr:hypothetical protein [Gemmataceae bacterium]
MYSRGLILALIVGLGLGWCAAWSAPVPEAVTPEDVNKLITQLASSRFVERERATAALDAIGPPALPALHEASKSEDIEVSRRAEALVKKIERRVERDKILAPTLVHLLYREVPLAEAVADLAKKTGFAIVLKDEARQLAARKVTVDTGTTTFWQALERFCQAAGLVELGAVPLRKQVALSAQAAPAVRGLPLPAAGAVAVSRTNSVAAGKGLILLGEGKAEQLATCYAGSIRIRLAPAPARAAIEGTSEGLLPLLLELSPEPKHEWFTVGEVRIEQVIDDNGQELSPVSALGQGSVDGPAVRLASFRSGAQRLGGGHYLPVWLAAPDRTPKGLKELRGGITAQVQLGPQPLLSVDHILQATGQTAQSAEGGSLKVLEVARQDDGRVKVRVEMQSPPQVIPGVGPQGFGARAVGRVIQIQPAPIQLLPAGQPIPLPVPMAPVRVAPAMPFAGWSYLGLSLLDHQGRTFQLDAVPQQQAARVNGVVATREITVLFKPSSGQGEARKLVFSGSRSVTLEVPFVLKDIALP